MIETIHATGLVLGEVGLIIRGPSGGGKSLLALDLLDRWQSGGLPASLVGDDRVAVVRSGIGLVMHPAPNLAGLVELRGRGIVNRPFLETAGLHLVIDLVDELVRMPEPYAFVTELLGVSLARAPVPRAGIVDVRHQLLLVAEAVRALSSPLRQA